MAYFLTMAMSSSPNAGTNQSTISFFVYLNSTTGQSYSGYNGMTIDWNIGGVAGNTTAPASASCAGGATPLVASSTTIVLSHDANGYLGDVSGAVTFNGSGGAAPGVIYGSASTTTTDYDRKPVTPTFGAIVRSVASISVNVNSTTSLASTPTYAVTRSENGGSFADLKSGQSPTFSGLPQGSTQQFRVTASNTDGTSGAATSSVFLIPSVPTAPTITVSTPSGKALTVAAGISADNGATVTGYFVQASPDNGGTWGTAQTMVSRSFSYTGLTGGATYKFRVYSTNEMGSSTPTTSASTFIPSGGRRWTGSAWVPTGTAKRWAGTTWVDLTRAKRWTGTAWIDLT